MYIGSLWVKHNIMLDNIFTIIEQVASSTQAAMMVSIAFNIALCWGWWRRETVHTQKYDQLRKEWIDRENVYYRTFQQHDEEIGALSLEAFSVLSDTASALSGMERTLDGLEMILRSRDRK